VGIGQKLEVIADLACSQAGLTTSQQITLENVKVVSDIIITDRLSNPIAVILVTHSEANSGSNMKSWRNIDESLQIHEHHPHLPVLSLIFPGNWKKEFIPIMEFCSGSQIEVPSKYKKTIKRTLSSSDEDRKAIAKVAKSVIDWIASQLTNWKNNWANIVDPWDEYGKSAPTVATKFTYERDNTVKRGLARLLCNPPSCISDAVSATISQKSAEALIRSGTVNVSKSLKGVTYKLHPEVEGALEALGKDRVQNVLKTLDQYHAEDIHALVGMLRGVAEAPIITMHEEMLALNQKKGLEKYIFEGLELWSKSYPGTKNIPLECLFTMGKLCEPTVSHRTASEFCGLDMIGGVSPLPQFLYGNKALPKEKVRLLSRYFAGIISPKSYNTSDLMAKAVDQGISKIMKHRYVNPLLYVCIEHVNSLGMRVTTPSKPMIKIGNRVVDHLARKGEKFSTDVAMTSFSFLAKSRDGEKDNIFLVISAYDSTHKHKEYPARWRLANCEFVEDKAKWSQDLPNLTVILDGLWSDLYDDHQQTLKAFALPGIVAVTDIKSWLASQ